MKINRLLLKINEPAVIEEEVDFSSLNEDTNHIKRIPSCKAKAVLTDFEDVLVVDLYIQAEVVASCAYTLEDVPLKKKLHERLVFTDNEDLLTEDMYLEKENEINLDPYILSFIIVSVPHNVHKPGAKLPEAGNGYRVISEEDFELERKTKHKDSPFDILDDIDL